MILSIYTAGLPCDQVYNIIYYYIYAMQRHIFSANAASSCCIYLFY